MSGYADPHEEALAAMREREYKRRRILSGIRGAIRHHSSPRWLTFACLAASMVPGVLFGIGAHYVGLGWPASLFLSVIAAWPFFIALIWQVSNLMTDKIPFFENLNDYQEIDERISAEENRKEFAEIREDIPNGVSSGLREGFRQSGAGGGMPLPILILVILVSCGIYLVWQLVRYGPTLWAEMVFDAHIAVRNPKWAERVVVEDWAMNTFVATTIHFVGVAVVVLLLAAIVPMIPTTGWER